jgi:hypothetical protein
MKVSHESACSHGILFVFLGLAALLSEGIPYTSRDNGMGIGARHATTEEQKTIALSPLVGLVAISVGVLALIGAVRKIA